MYVDQSFLFCLLQNCKDTEYFIRSEFKNCSDGVIGRAFALRVGVQVRAKTDISLYKM